MRDPVRPPTGYWRVAPRLLAVAGCVSALLVLAAARYLPATAIGTGVSRQLGYRASSPAVVTRAAAAMRWMERAESYLLHERERLGVRAEGEAAGDRSGLLGGEVTPLMTTLGSLEAKRLSTNPEWARVLTLRLADAGIGAGDVVAAGLSGSFPGLNLALSAACDALGARLVAVSSVTASTWGANQAGFTWPEMEVRLVQAGILARPVSVAVTAGGDADMALDLEADGRALASAIRDTAARRLGAAALQPRDFQDAVARRRAVYRRAANGRRIALYANVGGADASLGRSSAVLRLRSGFLPPVPFGRPQEQGVTAHFARDGVRILVLLNVRDLALRWGVPLAGP